MVSVSRLLLWIIFCLAGIWGPAYGQTRYFYTGKEYGSEACFNPLTFVINSGFDILQQDSYTRKLSTIDYPGAGKRLSYLLSHPLKTIDGYGTKNFFHAQIIPNEWKMEKLEWVPNYTLHILGAGSSFTTMREWYSIHDVPYPYLASLLTIYSGHVVNELIEISNRNYPLNVDPIADVYLFDVAGIALFSIDAVNEFCSTTLHLSDWSGQPSLRMPSLTLENNGQNYAAKIGLPYLSRWSLFSYFGNGSLFGLSYRNDGEECISAGGGFKMRSILINATGQLVFLDPTWEAGVFYDRNNSLLASLVVSGTTTYSCCINIYPGVVSIGNLSPGLFASFGKEKSVIVGVSTHYTFHVGQAGKL